MGLGTSRNHWSRRTTELRSFSNFYMVKVKEVSKSQTYAKSILLWKRAWDHCTSEQKGRLIFFSATNISMPTKHSLFLRQQALYLPERGSTNSKEWFHSAVDFNLLLPSHVPWSIILLALITHSSDPQVNFNLREDWNFELSLDLSAHHEQFSLSISYILLEEGPPVWLLLWVDSRSPLCPV